MNVLQVIQKLSKDHNLKILLFNSQEFHNHPTSVRLEADFNGRTFLSWGVDFNKDLAYFKALMELVERISLSQYCPLYYKRSFFDFSPKSIFDLSSTNGISNNLLCPENSNGAAVGLNPWKTKNSAFCELVERHTILSAIYLGIPPEKLNVSKFDNLPKGHNLKFYFWYSSNLFTVVCVDFLKTGGFLFSHSCSRELNQAIDKAFLEIVPSILHSEKTTDQKLSITNVEKDNLSSFALYWRYSGDDRAIVFLESTSLKKEHSIINLKEPYFSRVMVPEIFQNFSYPIYCYRTVSPFAQQLFFDNWDLKYINKNALPLLDLPTFPHFIA